MNEAYHVGNRSTWENNSANELADEVKTAVLIRDCHDDADGYEEDGGNGKGEQQTIPREVYRVVLDDKDANSKHCNKCGKIPTNWSVFVAVHQTAMDVFTAHASSGIRLYRAATLGACCRLGALRCGPYGLVLLFVFSGPFCK